MTKVEHMISARTSAFASFFCAFAALLFIADASESVKPLHDFSSLQGLGLKKGKPQVIRLDNGEHVLKFDESFDGRIDLRALGIVQEDYDLLKVDVKTDDFAFIRFSLENYPRVDNLTHWYVLDGQREEVEWQTIFVDLGKPEEIKASGAYKGMDKRDPEARGFRFKGNVRSSKRRIQGAGRSIWLKNLRFVKKTFDMDWDQRQASYRQDDKALTYRYPITLTNRLNKDIEVGLYLKAHQTKLSSYHLEKSVVSLAAKKSTTVHVELSLPSRFLADLEPLYTERYELRAHALGHKDSELSLFRSSDTIYLPVTVPIAEDKIAFPILPRRKDLPEEVTLFNDRERKAAVELAEKVSTEHVDTLYEGEMDRTWMTRKALFSTAMKGKRREAATLIPKGMSALAFLHDEKPNPAYVAKAEKIFLRLAHHFNRRLKIWQSERVAPISHGIIGHSPLSLGWIMGSMRSPYWYRLHGMLNDFDLMAKDMNPDNRQRIIKELFEPMAIQMRNHYVGPSNMQTVSNYPVLYAGIVSRNWPLVAFSLSSSHGFNKLSEWAFDDDGLCKEGHYHKATVRPMLWYSELMYALGINLYNKRFHTILYSKGAEAIGMGYNDAAVEYISKRRFPKSFLESDNGEGYHLYSGSTVLKQPGIEVIMNWGADIFRSAPDRTAFSLRPARTHALGKFKLLGGGTYSHSSLGQSIVIVNEGVQNTHAAQVVSHQVSGPMQHVLSFSDRHFPGSQLARAFVLVDDQVLIIDRIVNMSESTVDWCLKGVGGEGYSLDMQQKKRIFYEQSPHQK